MGDAWTAELARWVGGQAERRGRYDDGLTLVPEELVPSYVEGAQVARIDPRPIRAPAEVDEPRRRRLLRLLDARHEAAGGERHAPPLEVAVVSARQRRDIGTATRYDLVLGLHGQECDLRDLRAGDVLDYRRLRPIALDAARLALPGLRRGQGPLWDAAVQGAMASAEVVELEPGQSEALEIREALSDAIEAAHPWTWSDEDPYPRGIAAITYHSQTGWPRGPLLREVRAAIGRVSRVALSRACRSLDLTAREWRVETAHLRVWARPEVTP